MKYYALSADKLTYEHYEFWTKIHKNYSCLSSPYFHPSFMQEVASVRDDVYIGIVEDNNEIVGFFPHHRSRTGKSRPLGLGLSDYQGVVVSPELDYSPIELLRGCKLVKWDFDHLIVEQKPFSEYHVNVNYSPIIQVYDGFDAFKTLLNASGRKQLKEAERKKKRLAEEVGSVHFTLHSTENNILKTLIEWKSEQCKRSGTVDYFSIDWCKNLVTNLYNNRRTDFGGMLSCLYAGDMLAAVHFCMYTDKIWHSWFPAYNHALEAYSPGSILLYEMIEAAAERKIQYIDLGKGVSLYKKRVMTGSIAVAEGSVELSSFSNSMQQIKNTIENRSKQSFLKPVLRVPGKILNKIEREGRYR